MCKIYKVFIYIIISFGILFSFSKIDDSYSLLAGFDSLNTKFIGNWPFGYSYAVAYDSSRKLVFCGSGGGVYILNVSNPSNPQKISEKIHTRGFIQDIFYDAYNKRLYIAAEAGGIEIWDVSDPLNPQKLGRYFTQGYAYGIYVSGVYAYVADGDAGLQIYQFLLNVNESFEKDLSSIKINFLKDKLIISFPFRVKDPFYLSIYNSLGQKMGNYYIEKGIKKKEISLKDFSSGIYFIKLKEKQMKFMILK